MTTRASILTIFISAIVCTSVYSLEAKLVMTRICCDKTTEGGADETYIIVYGRCSDGRSYLERMPSDRPNRPEGHWDMNDGDQPNDNSDGDSHCLEKNKTLFSGDLPSGQEWNLHVLILEEDGGTTKELQEALAALSQDVPNPYVAGAGLILGALAELGITIKDTDDFIGSFGVRVTNIDGAVKASWKEGERLKHLKGNGNSREARMEGDGSNYVADFTVK